MFDSNTDLIRLKFYISKIKEYYNNDRELSLSKFENIAIYFLYQIVNMSENLFHILEKNNFYVANILTNSMCDATLQLLWMYIKEDERAILYEAFSNIETLTLSKNTITNHKSNLNYYKLFLKPQKNKISNNRKDYVNEWFQYNNETSNYNKRSRKNLCKEWELFIKANPQNKDLKLVNIYKTYQITCGFKHFSPFLLMQSFDKSKDCFCDKKHIKDLAISTAIMSLEFILALTNPHLRNKLNLLFEKNIDKTTS